jgi:hypothetical protein
MLLPTPKSEGKAVFATPRRQLSFFSINPYLYLFIFHVIFLVFPSYDLQGALTLMSGMVVHAAWAIDFCI